MWTSTTLYCSTAKQRQHTILVLAKTLSLSVAAVADQEQSIVPKQLILGAHAF